MSSYLELIIGPMFSGKTTYIINKYKFFNKNNKKILAIKPFIDNRYSNNNKIISHNQECIDCKIINKLSDVDNEIYLYDIIIIDEGQFFDNLKEIIINWINNYNLYIIICGLNGDYKKEKIGEILELIPYCDECIKLNSLCSICNDGTKAPFTYRTIKSDEKILIGENDKYMPVCRKHHRN